MRAALSLWPLLMAAALMLSANGLQNTILALRGIAEGFSPTIIGLLLSAYFVGFILGCRFAPRFIAAVGHIRAFTAFASIASAAVIAHAVIVDATCWLALRIVTGFALASLQMIMESWLNDRADNATRGQVLSVYRIVDFTGITLAQASVALFDPTAFIPFAVMSIALSVALVPVALTRVKAPAVPATAKLDLKRLWSVSPLAAASALGIGITASSFWSMGPLFVSDYGYEPAVVGYFIAAIIFGGAVAQWPIGYISDRADRRWVITFVSLGAGIVALFLPWAAEISERSLIVAALIFGIFALPGFGLAIAHANDHAEPGQSVSVNGALLMLYGVAAVAGPVIAPFVMKALGQAALFYWVSGLYAVLVLFCFYRMTQRAAPENQEPYVPVPRTSPAIFELDPRSEDVEQDAEDSTDGTSTTAQ
ncbi:MAG: MFS transporter [Pseudomonadota bacterium]